MRMYPREFPATRRRMPKRRAERRTFQALAGSDRQGFVYYEWRRGYGGIELDFAVWIVGLGRFALQVKGGHYLLIDGDWHLKTRNGLVPIEKSPLDEAWLAALDLHDDIEERAAALYNPYVIPVLAFADMEPDPVIEGLARRKGVYLIWRTGDLVADLGAVAHGRGVPDALPHGPHPPGGQRRNRRPDPAGLRRQRRRPGQRPSGQWSSPQRRPGWSSSRFEPERCVYGGGSSPARGGPNSRAGEANRDADSPCPVNLRPGRVKRTGFGIPSRPADQPMREPT